MQSKPQCHKPYKSLKKLPIPEQLWNSISIDYIEKLPSSSVFDTILVIVDWLTKQAIFIPTHDTIISVDLACLFILHVFSNVRRGSHWGRSPQDGLGDERTCETTLASAYVLHCLSTAWSQLQMKGRKSEWK